MFIVHSDEGVRDFNWKARRSKGNTRVERKFHISLESARSIITICVGEPSR